MTLWYYAIAFEVAAIAFLLLLIRLAPEMPNEGHFDA